MKIGVVSDTHGFFDPYLKEILAGVELILHGGDVDGQAVLDELSRIAPVRGVRGNVDPPELNLPLSLKLGIEGVQVEMMHIMPVLRSELEECLARALLPDGKPPQRREAFLKTFDDATGVVIFGHSHQPSLTALGRRLFLNPGSAGKKRFSSPRCCGVLEILPDRIQARIQLLERYNGKVPGRIQMNIGGVDPC